MPQPSDPIAPAANRLPLRIRIKAVLTALSMIDLLLAEVLFIVLQYKLYHIVLSTENTKKLQLHRAKG
jgi:hypothetical protein